MEYGFYVLYFCLGVLMTVTILHEKIWPKAVVQKPMNADDLIRRHQISLELDAIQARLSSLESAKKSKIDMVEIADAIKLCREEQAKIREAAIKDRESAIEDREQVSKIVLRLVATAKTKEKKEISA